jgi:hypothetical protein
MLLPLWWPWTAADNGIFSFKEWKKEGSRQICLGQCFSPSRPHTPPLSAPPELQEYAGPAAATTTEHQGFNLTILDQSINLHPFKYKVAPPPAWIRPPRCRPSSSQVSAGQPSGFGCANFRRHHQPRLAVRPQLARRYAAHFTQLHNLFTILFNYSIYMYQNQFNQSIKHNQLS